MGAEGLGFQFYDPPPKTLPQNPMWPPSHLAFRAPLRGPEPILPDSTCWKNSRKGSMDGCPPWVAETAIRQEQAAAANAPQPQPAAEEGFLSSIMAVPEPLLLLSMLQSSFSSDRTCSI